jgi:protein-arginine kinase activator protein McsA
MICKNCGIEYENETRVKYRYCTDCRHEYGQYLYSGFDKTTAGKWYRPNGRDRYSERLRDGFYIINGWYPVGDWGDK